MRRAMILFVLILAVPAGLFAAARLTVSAVDGVPCDVGEQVAYHVHAHLTIDVRGTPHYPPAGVGIHPEHFCFYWLHTHDATGMIHIEAPHAMNFTLGQFFAIWGKPLTRTQIADYAVKPPEALRIFVGHTLYHGDPAAILLKRHSVITMEIGPPFVPVQPVQWNGL